MLNELNVCKRTVGIKQTRRAIREGLARKVYLAADADPALVEELRELCVQRSIPVEEAFTMRQIGAACTIAVGAAAAAVLQE